MQQGAGTSLPPSGGCARFLGHAFPAGGVSAAKEANVLDEFMPEAQELIRERLAFIRSLARYISKDFVIPIELAEAGSGWRWDSEKNIIFVDPVDLIERPFEFIEFVIAHEATHRRISRFGAIPKELWSEPGYSFMTNAIEDPRANNFLAEVYPFFKRLVEFSYSGTVRLEQDALTKAISMLGYEPLFVKGGLEYIRAWLKGREDGELHLSEGLPQEVEQVIEDTFNAADRSWNSYPSRDEVDQGESEILQYAEKTFIINRDDIWPEFQKLVEVDLENQEVQELLKILEQMMGESEEQGLDRIPQSIRGRLTEEEQEKLEQLLEDRMFARLDGNTDVVPFSSLSENMVERLKDFIDDLPEDAASTLNEGAKESLRRYEGLVNDAMEQMVAQSLGTLSGEGAEPGDGAPIDSQSGSNGGTGSPPQPNTKIDPYEVTIQKPEPRGANRYRHTAANLRSVIKRLERTFSQIFRDRQHDRWKPNHPSGRSIDIRTRIREVAQDVAPVDSRSWRRRSAPLERDYAITILIDLTGSMSGEKVQEAFKALVSVLEPLNRLGIRTEVLGFNSALYLGKSFNEQLSTDVRGRIGSLVDQTKTSEAGYTDDGWALALASARLARIRAKRKFIIVCTDGQSNPSSKHNQPEFRLTQVVERIRSATDQVLVGLGLGKGTEFVEKNYPNALSNIDIGELSEKLAKLLEEILKDEPGFRR